MTENINYSHQLYLETDDVEDGECDEDLDTDEEEWDTESETDEESSDGEDEYWVQFWSSTLLTKETDVGTKTKPSSKILRSLFEKGYNADVFLMVNGDERKLPAHRFILVTVSAYFETRLLAKRSDWNEIFLVNLEMSFETLQRIVEYIYTSDLSQYEFSFEELKNLLFAAHHLQVDALDKLSDQIDDVLDISNVLQFYEFSELWEKNTNLVESLKVYVAVHFKEIVNDDEAAFLALDSKHLLDFLGHPDLWLNGETEVFEMIVKWIDNDYLNRHKHFAKLLRCVRYELMSLHFIMGEIFKRCTCVDSKRYVIELLAMREGYKTSSGIVNTKTRNVNLD